ncbi:MAG: citrate lyase, beta subunit [Hydrocarboniphaga sp.]|uniref:HpcH/HpaI aldolase/citrate lyase family protein n=1 Tax=Hydrocarboniphaga sp. TaxID=2033016 RepID=UPI0026258137|nr:CoA ester lyase [Hydrocarboniphaga sp.]MDB5969676.1 citrate lyase, beta subunit [Hydrocarboniphaga sp.]
MTIVARVWRSMLFLPAHVEKFVERAHTRGADAYILDLEDSVPAAEKARARALIGQGAQQLIQNGAAALVRINAGAELAAADIQAACLSSVAALVLPKINGAMEVAAVAAQLDALEASRGLVPGRIRLIAQIEDVAALPHLDQIATSSPRLLGMILGSEDFSVSAGMEACPEALFAPNQQIVFACRRAGILPFGFPASIAGYADLGQFRGHIRLARRIGSVGAFCIHPTQIAVLNEEFSPSPAEIEDARGVIAALEAGLRDGKAAVSYMNRMIDPPVAARAHEVLRRAGTESQ